MTDIEMDLLISQARIKQLEKELAEEKARNKDKCSFGEGVIIRPDGVNDLDPCRYELIETHENVTVEVLRCKMCGHIELLWHPRDDTEDGGLDG